MLVQTGKLEGRALAWAVAEAEGWKSQTWHPGAITVVFPNAPRAVPWDPANHQVHGGRILDEQKISTIFDVDSGEWQAATEVSANNMLGFGGKHFQVGPTRLIAGLRCRVAMKFGDTVDVPDELVTTRLVNALKP